MSRFLSSIALLATLTFSTAFAAPAPLKVDINRATEKQLVTLKGIGPKKAHAIVRYREQHGGFKTIEELERISGIHQKMIARWKGKISLSRPLKKPVNGRK